MRDDQLARVQKRIQRYWYEDGIGDIAGGGLFLALALYFGGHAWLPEGSLWRAALDGCLILFLAVGIVATRRLIFFLKTVVTYPRTGYAELSSNKADMPKRLITAAVGFAGGILIYIVGRAVGSFNWVTAITGVVFCVIFSIIAVRVGGFGRFYFLALLSLFLGIGLAFSPLTVGYNLALFHGSLGLVSIAMGGATLSRFLKENPIVREDENES